MATYSHAIGCDGAIVFVCMCARELHVTARLLIAKLTHVPSIIEISTIFDVLLDYSLYPSIFNCKKLRTNLK